ncbi:MAG: DUF1573 domain-containing protein [Bacteroidota bacterium]
MEKNYKAIMLTILTLSVFTLVIIELTGVSSNAIFRRFRGGGEGKFYSKEGEVYRGEIFPEQTSTRTQKVREMRKTTMQFYETKFDFGKVPEGKTVKHAFRFKNTGNSPLMISKTDVSCGCTVTDFSEEPVAPDADGEVTVQFNTAGKSGIQKKNIIVHSNALPEAVSISIEANVD